MPSRLPASPIDRPEDAHARRDHTTNFAAWNRIGAPDLFIGSRSGPEEKPARLDVNKSASRRACARRQFGFPPRRRMNESVRWTTFSQRFAWGGKPLGTLTHTQVQTIARLALYDLRGGPANPKTP